MADQLNPEEFQRASNDILRNMQDGLPIRKEELEQLKKHAETNQKINAQLGQTTQNLKAFGQSALDGKLGVTQFNQGIDAGVAGFSALSTALGTLKLFAGPLGIALKVLTFGVGLTAKAFKTVNEQSEALFKTYQDLSKTGQAAAGGMTEVFNNMQKFGYGIKELDQMTALLKENSVALAAFGGTAATGSKAFADAAGQIQRSDIGKTLQMMGKTPDEINKGIAGFIKQQQLAGVSSATIQKDLAQRSAEYVKQLDLMSKLTGESNEALQANRESALAESAFNQTIYELQKKGDTASLERAAELQKASDLLAKTPALQKEFWQGVGGDISAMGKSLMISADAVLYTQDANFKAATFVDKFAKGADSARESLGSLYKYNSLDNVLGSAKELSIVQSRYATTTAQNQEDMAKAQQEAQKTGLDPNTKAMVNARIEQMNTRDALQSLVQKGVEPATGALEGFSKFLNKISGVVPGTNTKETDNKIGGGGDKKAPPSAPAGGAAPSSGGAAIVSPGKSVQIGDEVRTGGDPNWRNNNPGNIRYTQFAVSMGAIGENGGFAVFPSEAMGRTAQDALLKGEAYAKLSAADAIRKWAPKNENDSENYIKTVAKLADVSMDKKYVDMSKAEQERFLDAMKKMEGSKVGTVTKAAGSVATTAAAPVEKKETKALVGTGPAREESPKKTTVSGNMSMGKPSGPIEYNGQTVKPEDAGYAEASNALVASTKKFDEAKQRSREARTNMAGSRGIGAAPKSSPPPAQTSSAPAQTTSAPAQTTSTNDLSGAKPDLSAKLGPNEQGVKPAVLAKKQSLEASLGKKLVVTSGFRPGAKNHGSGDAIDLGFNANSFTEDEKNKILKSAIDLGFTGIGAEYNAPGGPHIHLDTSHPSLVGWGSDYTAASLEKDSPYAASLIKAKQQGVPLPASPSVASVARPLPDKISAEYGFNGMLSGPTSGYKPDITMHGTENLKITPTGPGKLDVFDGPDAGALMSKQLDKMDQLVQAFNNTSTQDMMIMQLTKLDELVRVMQNQVNVSTKILQQSR